ncbi:MAG: glycosyltransferase family 2 protein [Cytophagales bacterium]|nr:glycosyltransferase family 2 protein [Cytophagales bacterium]
MLEKFVEEYQKVPLNEYANKVYDDGCLLTVRVTTYNHGSFIAACLDSILAQRTNFKYQILIMEDDSGDHTRDICKEYADRFPEKIRLILNSRENNIQINGKPTGLFNSVYSYLIINTPYIAIIEGDDLWTDPENLQKKVDVLEKNKELSFCFSDGVKFSESSEITEAKLMLGLGESRTMGKSQAISIAIPTASLVFRNIVEDKVHEETFQIFHADLLLRSKLLHYGQGYFLSNVKPIGRRIHEGGSFSSLRQDEKLDGMIQTRKKILEYFDRKGWESDFVFDDLCRVLKKKIRWQITNLKPSIGSIIEYFRLSLNIHPKFRK